MNAKDYLMQYKISRMRVARYEERIEQLENVLKGIEMDGQPKGSTTGDPTKNTAIALALLREQYQMALDEAERIGAEIHASIEKMADEKLKTLLIERYILFRSWEQVTERMSQFRHKEYEPKSVMGYLHKKALKEFDKVRR